MERLLLEVREAHKMLDEAKIPTKSRDGRNFTLAERIKILLYARKVAFKAGYKAGVRIGKKSMMD